MQSSSSSVAMLRWHSQNSSDVEGAIIGADRSHVYSNARKPTRWQGLETMKMELKAGRFVATTRTFRLLIEVSNTG